MYIDREMMNRVARQFRLDCNIGEKDKAAGGYFLGKTASHMETPVGSSERARFYEGMDYLFRAILFMEKGYLMAGEEMYDWCREIYQISGCVKPEWFCKFNNLRALDEELYEYGREIADTHLYYLPAADAPLIEPLGEVKWMEGSELLSLKENNPFRHALCFSERMPDVLAVAAMDGERIAAVAGCSEDSHILWQIGVDVDPAYEKRGLGVNLVALLKQEILRRGKIPFYGTSESHTMSRMVAVKAGFLPAWAEVYVKCEV